MLIKHNTSTISFHGYDVCKWREVTKKLSPSLKMVSLIASEIFRYANGIDPNFPAQCKLKLTISVLCDSY